MPDLAATEPYFGSFLGIDYSGASHPVKGLPGLSMFSAGTTGSPREVLPEKGKWSRSSLCDSLAEQLTKAEAPTLIGIDHGIGFPYIYYRNHRISTWRSFLTHLCKRWPQLLDGTVEDALAHSPLLEPTSGPESFRLTETWTSGPSSVFRFHHNGAVGKSTFSGLAQLHRLLSNNSIQLHIWPCDGWDVPHNSHVLCEIYPSLYKKRYHLSGVSPHQHDAFAVVSWMQDMQTRGALGSYFSLPLTAQECIQAQLEGWILGVR